MTANQAWEFDTPPAPPHDQSEHQNRTQTDHPMEQLHNSLNELGWTPAALMDRVSALGTTESPGRS